MGAIVHLEPPQAAVHGCRYCWMCRHVCPVGHVTQRETLTPHAWALTIDAVSRGTLAWHDESVDVLYSCADCGMCRTHCVTDQPLPDAIAHARAEVAANGAAPRIAYALRDMLVKWGNPYAEQAPLGTPARPARGEATGTAGGASNGHAAAVAAGVPGAQAERGGAAGSVRASSGEVALFVGDAGAHLEPGAVAAATTLLRAAGFTTVPIGIGRSNGALASSLGFPETAAALAHAVLADVAAAGCVRLLVLGPGDRWAFERLYRERLDVAWPEAVAIDEVSSVLAAALRDGRLTLRMRAEAPPYAYHDPCHGPRIDREAAAPRALLAAALGEAGARRLFWREGRAHPCGATGGLEFTQPDIALTLADARLADATAAGATWLVTDDPTCLHHLRSRNAPGVAVRGLYELLVEQLAE